MWDFSLTGAFALMARTAPFLLFRMAVYFGMACAYVIATGTGVAIGYGVGQLGDEDFMASSTALGASRVSALWRRCSICCANMCFTSSRLGILPFLSS
ncbi:hypothetical protein V6L77_22440 [Pannonibacter sp. Pt2-lr]